MSQVLPIALVRSEKKKISFCILLHSNAVCSTREGSRNQQFKSSNPGKSDDPPGPQEESSIPHLQSNAIFLWIFPKMFHVKSYYLRVEFIFTPNCRSESLRLLNYAFSGYCDPWNCENVHIQGEFSDSKMKKKKSLHVDYEEHQLMKKQ